MEPLQRTNPSDRVFELATSKISRGAFPSGLLYMCRDKPLPICLRFHAGIVWHNESHFLYSPSFRVSLSPWLRLSCPLPSFPRAPLHPSCHRFPRFPNTQVTFGHVARTRYTPSRHTLRFSRVVAFCRLFCGFIESRVLCEARSLKTQRKGLRVAHFLEGLPRLVAREKKGNNRPRANYAE